MAWKGIANVSLSANRSPFPPDEKASPPRDGYAKPGISGEGGDEFKAQSKAARDATVFDARKVSVEQDEDQVATAP